MGRVKKVNGIIYGYEMTAAEKKAMDIEIRRALAEYDRKNTNEVDALFLWAVHELFGFGHDRLMKLHQTFRPALDGLCEKYEMSDPGDDVWLCTKKLKDIGVDIEKWNEGKYT
jgi:GTPase SAR1 family protein